MTVDASQEHWSSDVAGPRPDGRLRVAVIDCDPGFMQVLAKRLDMWGAHHCTLTRPVSGDVLVPMRLNALVIDPDVLGPTRWEYLERLCSRLPGLAVVVCTGPSSVAQRVRGLRLGIDAWMTKPCHPEEVVSVIVAAARRHRRQELPGSGTVITAGELTIRPDLHQAYVGNQDARLTAREFEVLYLLSQADGVLDRDEIYQRVWGYAMTRGDRSVDVFVRKLRQKLEAISPQWNYIHTHFGVGYRFAPELLIGQHTTAVIGERPLAPPDQAGDMAQLVQCLAVR